MFFLKRNWKGILFPIVFIGIICFDYCIGNEFALTCIKLLFFSVFHALYVCKTKYVYDSDVYRYLNDLKFEYERHHIIKPFLSHRQVTIVYICLILTFVFQSVEPFRHFALASFAILSTLLVLDAINIFLRSLTNQAELKNIKPPPSLMQTRFMFTAFTKIFPNCVAASRIVIGTGIGTEVVYPAVTGNGNAIGPMTKVYSNKVLYPELKVPVESKLDSMYESFKQQNENMIRPKGEPPLPERTCNLRKEQDLLDMGLSQGDIDSMTGKNMPSLIGLKK